MRPGVVSLHGFLGDDPRSLREILDEDDALVRRLGISHAEIAERLGHFMDLALSGFGAAMREGDFEVVIHEVKGAMECPFGDLGRFRKGEIQLANLKTGEALTFTPLQVHLIGEHGFYEGKGSPYRLDPEAVASVLGLLSR